MTLGKFWVPNILLSSKITNIRKDENVKVEI